MLYKLNHKLEKAEYNLQRDSSVLKYVFTNYTSKCCGGLDFCSSFFIRFSLGPGEGSALHPVTLIRYSKYSNKGPLFFSMFVKNVPKTTQNIKEPRQTNFKKSIILPKNHLMI